MSETPRGKLGDFLREVSNMTWDEFWKAERNRNYTTNQSIVLGLIRACAMEQMSAIKLALNRLDGKLKTPVKIETPKVYYLYPSATGVLPSPTHEQLESGETVELVSTNATPTLTTTMTAEPTKEDLPAMGLRDTMAAMADYPRELPEQIVALAQQTEQWLRGQGTQPPEIPMVKSVVAAHLLVMAQKRDIEALYEVFDQIDGKLVETIQLLGEDIYITDYSLTAPAGAQLNADGVYQLEAAQAQATWSAKLEALRAKA